MSGFLRVFTLIIGVTLVSYGSATPGHQTLISALGGGLLGLFVYLTDSQRSGR